MKEKRFALAGLILSALSILTFIVLALLKGVQKLGLYTPAQPAKLITGMEISIAVFILGLALYAIFEPDKVRRLLTGRKARYGSNAFVLTLAFVGILAVVNYLAYQNPKHWDLTEGKEHTLAPETIQALETLPEQVQAIAFFSSRTPTDTAEKLLRDYKANSGGKFNYHFMDPDLNPLAAQEAGITGDGKILLRMGDRQEIAAYASEEELTRALIRLINPEERVVYFLTGHGERNTEQGGDASITRFVQTLKGKNYTVHTLNLQAEAAIPEDASLLVVAGPTNPVSEEEVTLLQDWVAGGGALLVMEDPAPLTDIAPDEDPLANYLQTQWGISFQNDLVIDPQVTPPSNAVAYQYGKHPITEKMNNVVTFFPFSRSLEVADAENVSSTPLVYTIDRAWGETDFSVLKDNTATLQFDEDADFAGPLILAAAAEGVNGQEGRIVVFGDSFFAADQFFDSYGNGDIAVNAVDWATEQENLINLTPKEQVTRTFKVPTDFQLISIFLGSICLLPMLALIGGFTAWLNRRKRG
jgi:ABC-type uncharacterized transport system involved in gliding motility auxiliary subunit